jgi:hypothetical protein
MVDNTASSTEPDRIAKVAPNHPANPVNVLDHDGPVGAQLGPQVCQVPLRVDATALSLQDGQGRVTGDQAHHHKNNDRDQQHGWYKKTDSFCRILSHLLSDLAFSLTPEHLCLYRATGPPATGVRV